MITKEELYNEYITLDKTKRQVRLDLSITRRALELLFKEYNISKSRKDWAKKGLFIKGHKLSTESIERMREKNTGRKHSLETKKKMSISHIGKKFTPEQRLHYRASKLGEKNPQYINGKFERKIDKYIRELKEYTDWRRTIFERDSYTCKDCGKHNCELNAHHIIPFIVLVGELRNKSKDEIILQAKNYEKLWDVDNGITPCLSCHYKTRTRND